MGKKISKPKIDGNTSIGKEEICPICFKTFAKSTTYFQMRKHLQECCSEQLNDGMSFKSLESTDNTNNKIKTVEFNFNKIEKKHIFKKYVPMKTTGKYCYNGKKTVHSDFLLPFEKKLDMFKKKLSNIKIDWREGCCNLQLTRENFLEDSIKQFNKINIYKELKINFKGEVSHDAGGIIREWFTIIFTELESSKRKLFEKQEDNDFNYIISRSISNNKHSLETFNFIGKSFAKALLENITINCCLNKIFYKILLNETILYEDLVFIDKRLYHSLQEMKKLDDLDNLELFFVINYESEGVYYSEELLQNGETIQVNKENLDKYIEQRIENLIKKDLQFFNEMRAGFLSVINDNIISIFNSDELELIINGQPFIDVLDWKSNTIYKGGYSEYTNVISWFWSILFEMSQEDLSKFLQFCTGTSRVPIGGFSSLESNRSEISRFCIVNIEYMPNKKNYIKAHTCFNRIDLPNYLLKKHLEEAILFILKNEIIGFGID